MLAPTGIVLGGAVADPFAVAAYKVDGFPIAIDPAGRTQVNPNLIDGEKTLIFIVAGQSNAANHDDTTYAPTNAVKVQNLSIYNGGIYRMADPLLGCTGGSVEGGPGSSWQGRLGDKLINAGIAQRVIFVPIAIAGSAIALWAPGGVLNHRLTVAAKRLWSLNLLSSLSAVLWQQGESDNSGGTSQAVYQARLNGVITTLRDAGVTAPFFAAQCTLQNDGSVSAPVRAAQAGVVDHDAGVWLGPDSDTLWTGYRDLSGGHFNATGSNANANLWKTALGLYGAPFV